MKKPKNPLNPKPFSFLILQDAEREVARIKREYEDRAEEARRDAEEERYREKRQRERDEMADTSHHDRYEE